MTARTWREADLRGGHGASPASVSSVVTRTRVALAAARWGESALFLIAGHCATLAALAASGAALGSWDAWAAGLLGGLLCGLAWALEHVQTAADVARELDSKLRHQGGLLTAWEIERHGNRSAMARLAVERIRRRLRPGEALRATFPPLALPIAAPLLGAGLLALVLDSQRPDATGEPDLSALLGGTLSVLDSVAEDVRAADGVDPATAREVVRVVREIKSLKRRADLLDGRPSDVLAEIERLDGKLAALEPRVGGDADLRARVGEARNWLDAARMGLSGFGGVADDPGSALAGAGPEGTMSGSATGGEGVPDVPGRSRVDRRDDEAPSPAVPTPGHDTGTTAETWWPPEYDRIVAGWTEWRRHALQNRAAGEDRDER